MFLSLLFQSTFVISYRVMALSYIFQSTLINFMIYTKITFLCLNVSRLKKTYLATINVTCCKTKYSSNLYPSSSRIDTTKRTTSSSTAILQLYLELGLRLTNVHRVFLINQSPWLKNYITFNTRQRTAAKIDFEKDFFKLINNAVFDKPFISLFLLLCSYILIHSL